MKKQFILIFIAIVVSSTIFAQSFPHNASNSSGAERVSNFGISGINNQRFEITNGTVNNSQFLPALWAHNGSTNYHSIQLHATTTRTYDTGSSPLMMFIASVPTTVNLSAPSGTQFPWGNGGTQQTVNTRPTFSWRNGNSTIMQLSSQNHLGLNTTSPTARLDVNGNARIRSIPTTSSDSYVLTVDGSGNVRKQLKSTIGGGGSSTNCTSLFFIPKSNGSGGYTCSQIIDNGVNVGIGTAFTSSKLTVNGDIRSLTNTFLSDRKYKKNIKTIDNALESVLKLNGSTYKWKKDEFADIDFSSKLQYGLIAQEVEEIFPELVHKDEQGGYGLNYTGLIPVLIEAVKEQQNQITLLSNKLSELENLQKGIVNHYINDKTKISSNYPNPFANETEVDLFIENNVKNAKIVIYDLDGSTISSHKINERGINTKFKITKKNLSSGVYFYTLITDGIVIGTQKMIVK
jgi:hypothetical protein